MTNENAATSFTAERRNTFSQNVVYTADGDTFGTFRYNGTTTASSAVTAGASAPTETSGLLFWAAAEILASGTLAEDASSPSAVSTTSATTLSTASFTPPAGSLIVAQVSSNYTGSGTLTMTVSGGTLTWVQLAGETLNLASVWVAQVPAAPVLSAPPPSRLIPPGLFTPMTFVSAPPPPKPAPPPPWPDYDIGSGSEAGSVTADVIGTDSGSGADSGSEVPGAFGYDSGTGTDTGAVTAASATSADTGTGADTGTAYYLLSDSDSGSGADAGEAGPVSGDAGTAADSGSTAPYTAPFRPTSVLWSAPDRLSKSGGSMPLWGRLR